MRTTSVYRQIAADRSEEFFQKGFKRRFFFPHKFYYLPKAGPDGLKMASRMCGMTELNSIWEIVLYADDSMTQEFPEQIFFDDDILWHQQHFGKAGQIATANLVCAGDALYSMVHISDLVQRISRRKEHRTRIENRFKGWNFMLLNAILNFAKEHGFRKIFLPAADFARRHTDPNRNPKQELFNRVYDRNLLSLFRVQREENWWRMDTSDNIDRLVKPEKLQEEVSSQKTICICHDIESGYGHVDTDPAFAESAAGTSKQDLERMLAIEKEFGVTATYNVLGLIFNEVQPAIGKDHCLAFHSYDHQFDDVHPAQLEKCRAVDYRIKGYRPPQSKITNGLSDQNLVYHNFEWIASSTGSLKIHVPQIQNRIVKIPIHFDDFELYNSKISFQQWENRAMEIIARNEFVAFGLHDCYGRYWLPYYSEFLQNVQRLGNLKTMDQVAFREIFVNAC